MCHVVDPFFLRLYGFDFYDGKLLAMPALAFIALPAVLFDYYHFLPALVFENLGRNARAVHIRSSKFGGFSVTDHKHFLDFNCVSGVRARKAVYEKNVAFFYGQLFPLTFVAFIVFKLSKSEQINAYFISLQVYF